MGHLLYQYVESNVPKNVYTFENMIDHIGYKETRFKVYINNMSAEFRRIMYPWDPTYQQKKCLITCQCSDIWIQQMNEFINNDHSVIFRLVVHKFHMYKRKSKWYHKICAKTKI